MVDSYVAVAGSVFLLFSRRNVYDVAEILSRVGDT